MWKEKRNRFLDNAFSYAARLSFMIPTRPLLMIVLLCCAFI